MAQRGRKSAASLSVVPIDVKLVRPDPPKELTKDQAAVWRDTVAAMRPDWFSRETWPLLVQLCRHICLARSIAEQIAATDPRDLARLGKLAAMQIAESMVIASLSTKLRLTIQSSRDPKTTKRGWPGPETWEITGRKAGMPWNYK
jgi:hypothetical protein